MTSSASKNRHLTAANLVRTKSSELVDLIMAEKKNDAKIVSKVSVLLEHGSTSPLVFDKKSIVELGSGTVGVADDDESYDPFADRIIEHPTTNLETLVHLLKGSLGSGILAMPFAFRSSGLIFGLVATCLIGLICTYCVYILVKCAHKLCRRTRIPALSFAEVAEVAFLAGPQAVKQYSKLAKFSINLFLVIDLLGCCCIYIVFVSSNMKQVLDHYFDLQWPLRIYIALLFPFIMLMNLIRNLKLLAPFSMLANCLIGLSIGITFYYVFKELPPIDAVSPIAPVYKWPMFFGTAIFALEGIGVVMSLENNMKKPDKFIGCPGVLNIGMSIVILLYSTVGFFGYWRFGDNIQGSISLNLPHDDILAQSVKLMIALAIFFTYSLQFYVPMEIIWKALKLHYPQKHGVMELLLRVSLTSLTFLIAISVPNLGGFISLIGAVCLSFLGLIFPAVIELVTIWEKPGLGRLRYQLWKNMFLIMFGVVGFLTGSYVSILEIIEDLSK